MKSKQDLTVGNINKKLWAFAIPLMLGNVMQQFYNLVDTWVVGKYIGDNALAAVGSSYSLMTFLTSILLGLCMGSGALFSIRFGQKALSVEVLSVADRHNERIFEVDICRHFRDIPIQLFF